MALRALQKWHGAGNDFLVEVIEHGTAPWWTPERAKALCDRTKGVGADGLLLAHRWVRDLHGALQRRRHHRRDVGQRRALPRGGRTTRDQRHVGLADVHTGAGVKEVTLHMDGDAGEGSVAMGEVTFG